MSISVQGRVPRDWNDETVSHISRRLIELERELAGNQEQFLSPSIPTFGPGSSPGGGGGSTAPSPSPSTPTESVAGMPMDAKPHVHTAGEVLGLLDEIRLASANHPHAHRVEDIPGAADDAQMILARQVFGG